MVDNKPSELQCELLVIHTLLKYDIKCSKPSFDQEGADLLIVDRVTEKTTAFLKAQCKYRSFFKKHATHVSIPIRYVTVNFVLFLYTIDEYKNDSLYVFFENEITSWKITNNEYRLSVSEKFRGKHQKKIFNSQIAESIKERLSKVYLKKYTSIIIDGIFLENALLTTQAIYQRIWPDKVIKKPSLNDIIHQLLLYNRFHQSETNIHCVLFLSNHFSLENWIDIPDTRVLNKELLNVHLSIQNSDKIIAFEVLEYLERIINAENILLVANDISYERPLNELEIRGVDIILIKLSTDLGSNLYTKHKWGDITYPLALAMGLEHHEL